MGNKPALLFMYGTLLGGLPGKDHGKGWMDRMATGKKPNTVAIATQLAQPLVDEMGLTLWDVRFEKEGSLWFLRYLVDKEGGVNIQECEDLSRALSKLLDETDPIEQSYYLEVGSPGVERELVKDWHFQRYLGHPVYLRLIRPVEGVRDFEGTLVSKEGDAITLLIDEDVEMTVQQNEAAYIRLVDDYDYSAAEQAPPEDL